MNKVNYKGECYDLKTPLITGFSSTDPLRIAGLMTIGTYILPVSIILAILVKSIIPIIIGIGIFVYITMSSNPIHSSDIPDFISKHGTKVTCPDPKILEDAKKCFDEKEKQCPQEYRDCDKRYTECNNTNSGCEDKLDSIYNSCQKICPTRQFYADCNKYVVNYVNV